LVTDLLGSILFVRFYVFLKF